MKRRGRSSGVHDVRVLPVVPITVRPASTLRRTRFGQLLVSDGTVLLSFTNGPSRPSVVDEIRGWTPGNGLLLFFRVDDYTVQTAKSTTLSFRSSQKSLT